MHLYRANCPQQREFVAAGFDCEEYLVRLLRTEILNKRDLSHRHLIPVRVIESDQGAGGFA